MLAGTGDVKARGVPRGWGACALLFLALSLLIGLGIGPVGIGAASILESALSHLPLLDVRSPLDTGHEAILWQLRAPRVVLLVATIGAAQLLLFLRKTQPCCRKC